VALLLLFRLTWGFVGNQHARFAAFVRPWAEVRRHGMRLLRLAPPRYLGHNPLGGWMVVALLLTLAVTVLTGLLSVADRPGALFYPFVPGFLAAMMEEVHEGVANLLLLLVGIHVLGVLADWLLTGDNLVRAMWTGAKDASADYADAPAAAGGAPEARGGSLVLALLLALLLAGLGWLLVSRTAF
jgi:cytochrome b